MTTMAIWQAAACNAEACYVDHNEDDDDDDGDDDSDGDDGHVCVIRSHDLSWDTLSLLFVCFLFSRHCNSLTSYPIPI